MCGHHPLSAIFHHQVRHFMAKEIVVRVLLGQAPSLHYTNASG